MVMKRTTVTETRRVRKAVKVKRPAVIHTLFEDAADKFSDADVMLFDRKAVGQAGAALRRAFLWQSSAEGHAFWEDVIDRLVRIADYRTETDSTSSSRPWSDM